MNRPFITRTFADVVDHAQRTDTPLVHAIALDTLGKVQPTTTRLYRLQMFGPCKVCGEAKFICEHDDDEFTQGERGQLNKRSQSLPNGEV